MTKTILKSTIISLSFFIISFSYAQIGVDNPLPNPFSILDLKATDKGLLIPRMTTAQRFTIRTSCNSSCPNGLMVYDTDKKAVFILDGNQWNAMSPFLTPDASVGSAEVTQTDNTIVSDMGIGVAPAVGYKLDVNGNTQIRGNALVQTDLTVQSGNVFIPSGNVNMTNGNFTNTNGNIRTTNGVMSANGFSTDLTATNVSGPVPKGGIIMWSGALGTIPTGWALCDGGNGTPDLRERFVVGASTTDNPAVSGTPYTVFQNGGESLHTLTIGEMPSHNHGGFTSTDGAHSHNTFLNDRGFTTSGPDGLTPDNSTTPYPTTVNGDHYHTIPAQGGGGAFENRPPFYALAFIMKL